MKSRQRRQHDVAQRLYKAELALREAADGLADYRRSIELKIGKVAP